MRTPRFLTTLLLASLVLSIVAVPSGAVAQSTLYAETFELTGLVQNPRTYTLQDLQSYPSMTITAAFGSGSGFEVGTFTGVSLWDLLQENRVVLSPDYRNDLNRKYIVATGSDGYEQVFALAEINPEFGGGIVLIAYARNGQLLGPDEGMARVVSNGDKRGGRLVSNLARLEVRDVDSPPRAS